MKLKWYIYNYIILNLKKKKNYLKVNQFEAEKVYE